MGQPANMQITCQGEKNEDTWKDVHSQSVLLKFSLMCIKRMWLCHGVGKLDKDRTTLFFVLQRLGKKGCLRLQ